MRPLKAIEIPKGTNCKFINISKSGEILTLGFDNGEYQLRVVEYPDKFMQIKMHDGQNGAITSVKFDAKERYSISTGADGLMYVYQFDREMMRKEALFDPYEDIENIDYIPKDELEQKKRDNWNAFYDEF